MMQFHGIVVLKFYFNAYASSNCVPVATTVDISAIKSQLLP